MKTSPSQTREPAASRQVPGPDCTPGGGGLAARPPSCGIELVPRREPVPTPPSGQSGSRVFSGTACIQARLSVRGPDDVLERAADRVAAEVVAGNVARAGGAGLEAPAGSTISRAAAEPAGAFNSDAANAGPHAFGVPPGFEQRLEARRGGGEPLPGTTRRSMEAGFHADFGAVRVHADPEAGQLCQSIAAEAFTRGADIYFNRGRFQPASPAGRELLAHELAHTLQQGASRSRDDAPGPVGERGGTTAPGQVQRKPLNPDEILGALDRIPFIRRKLDQAPERSGARKRDSLEAMRVQVSEVLGQYRKNLLEDADTTEASAMSIAVVLQAVARVIALNELSDPALAPILTTRLLELYRPEIEKQLKTLDHRDDALDLVVGLTADDPVALYMHQEIRVEDAARRIRVMAGLGRRTPDAMFELLRQRFEIEVAAYQREKIARQEDTGADRMGKFTVREATGEVSEAYFDRLFGRSVNQPAWHSKTHGRGRWEVGFGHDATARLAALERAVTDHPPGYTGGNRTWQRPGDAAVHELTPKQSAHLADVEQQEAALDRIGLDAQMIGKLSEIFKLDADAAAELLTQIKAGLPTLPLTLTVKGASWFSGGDPKSTLYQPGSSRRQETSLATLFEKRDAPGSIKHLGKFEDTTGQGRGENYGRFRNWKDQTMSGNRGFSDTELPSFGAVNINWPAHSTEKLDSGYGENSYGDTHFVLRKANLLSRLVYTATDHGRPRRDIYLAFCDFVLGDDAARSQTGLKKTENHHVVRQVVNALFTAKPVVTPVQCFEVQIFGELDIARDVEKIAVAPSVAADVQTKIDDFCRAHGIVFEPITRPAEALVNGAWFTRPQGQKCASLLEQLQFILAGATLPTGS